MALSDDIAGQFLSGKDGAGPAGPEPDADDSPGAMLIKAVNAGDAAGVEAAVKACMDTSY